MLNLDFSHVSCIPLSFCHLVRYILIVYEIL